MISPKKTTLTIGTYEFESAMSKLCKFHKNNCSMILKEMNQLYFIDLLDRDITLIECIEGCIYNLNHF